MSVRGLIIATVIVLVFIAIMWATGGEEEPENKDKADVERKTTRDRSPSGSGDNAPKTEKKKPKKRTGWDVPPSMRERPTRDDAEEPEADTEGDERKKTEDHRPLTPAQPSPEI